MGRFVVGVIVGVFLGVLVVAPNPLLEAKVRDFWSDARGWLSAVLVVAGDVADQAENVGEEAKETLDPQ